MRKLFSLCASLCAMALVAANTAQATGNNFFSYVSNTGSDSNTCTNPTTDACKTFLRALAQTANYGEIDCVNAGSEYGEGMPSIQQSITIDCAGAVGAVTNNSVVVDGPGIVVRLRNLTINVEGYYGFGIDGQNMAALYVENCVITNFNGQSGTNSGYIGVKFEPRANAELFVSNSVISDNGNSSASLSGGVYIVPASGVNAKVSIDKSQINGNYFGVVGDGRAGGIIHAAISASVVSGNTEAGIAAATSGAIVEFLLDQTSLSGNLAALYASGSNAAILARNTSIFNNTTGLERVSGGKLLTAGTNTVIGNATNGAFTGTAGQQ